ncbi:MAG: hypothetical protein QOE55_6057 [Acidobacteriaceae bacterium]|jgi:uncharacterized protein (DUF1800 family)|nr:hypothetical protein [Acidobacteriaceae bacterium]
MPKMPLGAIDTMAVFHLRYGLMIGVCSLTFVGCGRGGSNKATSQPLQNLLILNGTQITLACQQSVELSAAYGSQTPPHLSWIQSPSAATSGKTSATGVYYAPDNLPANAEVTITATDIDTGVSASTVLTLVNPVPVVTSVTPSNVDAGSVISGIISGTSFEPRTTVIVDGQIAHTTYFSSTSLSFSWRLPDWANGDHSVSAMTQGPGGGKSGSVNIRTNVKTISYDAAARFLQQATWGATPSMVKHVQNVGFAAFLDEQFDSSPQSYVIDSDSSHVLQTLWYFAADQDSNQLRSKTSWAWYKLFNSPGSSVLPVLSAVPEITNRDAFENFKTLFTDITLNLEMGMYLNYCCNDAQGPQPNENFGREAMQQFTTGPHLLNLDGTPMLSQSGSPQASYNSDDIEAIARSITGLAYPADIGNITDSEGLISLTSGNIGSHDTRGKILLGQSIGAGGDAITDTSAVIDILVRHPNTGTHISTYLIHEFVTSNPSPAYVARVSKVWADNGSGVQGDIRAVIKAILLDPEARAGDDPTLMEPDVFGRFRDAVNFGSALIRGLNAAPSRFLHTWGTADDFANLSHEPVFWAPSVFGYYSDYFTIPQTQVLAPEMQLYTTDAIAARAAFVKNIIYVPPNIDPYISAIDWSQWAPLAADDGSSLIDLLNHLLFHGTMSPELYKLLQDNLKSMPSSDLTGRAQQTIYLAVMSPEFAVER